MSAKRHKTSLWWFFASMFGTLFVFIVVGGHFLLVK